MNDSTEKAEQVAGALAAMIASTKEEPAHFRAQREWFEKRFYTGPLCPSLHPQMPAENVGSSDPVTEQPVDHEQAEQSKTDKET
jgi:hypothetical protein